MLFLPPAACSTCTRGVFDLLCVILGQHWHILSASFELYKRLSMQALLLPFFNAMMGVIGSLCFWPLTVFFPVQCTISAKKIPSWSGRWCFLQSMSLITLLVSVCSLVGSVATIIDELKVHDLLWTVKRCFTMIKECYWCDPQLLGSFTARYGLHARDTWVNRAESYATEGTLWIRHGMS